MAVTLSKYGSSINRLLCHLVGLSTDTKPISTYTDKSGKVFLLENGSSFEEMDTDKKYLYDAENQQWNLASSGGGGGGSATLIEKSITENGEYNASDDNADGYSKVTVDVPNTYTAQDEGKVVDNGALVAQTAMSSEVTENGTVDTTLYNSVTVNVPSSGGGSAARKDVNFYDYDGTIVNSYTAAEFAELTAMPSNPSHDGLTAQGWNWSLSDAKSYVASYGKLEIGQMYITSDGKTRLYITLTEGRTSPVLQLYLNANSELDIDWGDGSTHSTFTSTNADFKKERHNYANAGKYIITISVITGDFILKSSKSWSTILWNDNTSVNSPNYAYNNSIKKVEVGSNVLSIDYNAFANCHSLTMITIPNTITSIGQSAFNSCVQLKSITIPSLVTSIENSTFGGCSSLSSLSLPNSVISIDSNSFGTCFSLTTLTLPNSLTTINDTICTEDKSLTLIIIPNSVTSIGSYAFKSCSSLSSISIPSSVTSIGSNAFQNCYSLATITIDKTEGSISGSPWGAITGSSTSTQIIWTG